MPTTKYTITILNGLLQGTQIYKYSTYDVDNTVESLKLIGCLTSVKEQSLI
jgi:uncharacterized membrane protein